MNPQLFPSGNNLTVLTSNSNCFFPTTMKLLASALLFGALLALGHAVCYIRDLTPGMTHCQDLVDRTWHPVGSEWRNSNCEDCSCGRCCSSYPTPTNFPSDCVSVFDSVACSYIVHKKNNPSELCPIYGAVLK